jgi:hypothetical protein
MQSCQTTFKQMVFHSTMSNQTEHFQIPLVFKFNFHLDINSLTAQLLPVPQQAIGGAQTVFDGQYSSILDNGLVPHQTDITSISPNPRGNRDLEDIYTSLLSHRRQRKTVIKICRKPDAVNRSLKNRVD